MRNTSGPASPSNSPPPAPSMGTAGTPTDPRVGVRSTTPRCASPLAAGHSTLPAHGTLDHTLTELVGR
eukprot:765116-Alexandrium_andersonii.AAC.1